MKRLALVGVLGGCDFLFDIHRIDHVAVDGRPPDTLPFVDGRECTGHDEDHDDLPDECDLCPTMNASNADGDGDLVGDACDPDPARSGNSILAFYPFVASGAFMSEPPAGETYSNDQLVLTSTTATSIDVVTHPEVLTLVIDGLPATGVATIGLDLETTSTTLECSLGQFCGGPPTCLTAGHDQTDVSSLPMTLAPSEVRSLSLYRLADGTVKCSVNDRTTAHTATLMGVAIPNVQAHVVLVAASGAIKLDNLIVYGAE